MLKSYIISIGCDVIEQFFDFESEKFSKSWEGRDRGHFFEIAEGAEFVWFKWFKKDGAKLCDGIEFEDFLDEESLRSMDSKEKSLCLPKYL